MSDAAYSTDWKKLRKTAKRIYPATCHLCHGAIDLSLDGNHPMGWTLDHVYPVATYGDVTPTITEVRPAHRTCNMRRGMQSLAPSPRSEEW